MCPSQTPSSGQQSQIVTVGSKKHGKSKVLRHSDDATFNISTFN